MGKTKKSGKKPCSPAVKTANSLKQKYGTGSLSPGKCLRARRALIDVQEKKASIRQAAKTHSLSVSYLRRRLFGDVSVDSRNGPSPVFNKKEEEAMANWLQEMAQRGMGLKPSEFLDFVQNTVKKEKRKTPFVNDRPSYNWYKKFMFRNKHIIEMRTEKPLESSRAKLTRIGMDEWYCNYKKFMIENALLHKPECIYNADETGFNLASKAGKVIGPVRSTQNTSVPHVSGGQSKQRITVMFCGCADGSMVPPFLVYPEPRPRGYSALTGGIAGSGIAFTKKGWMDSEAYEDFLKHFDKHACKDRPVVLLIDSVSSHISQGAFEMAKSKGILLYRIIPNATHLMQPLDKGVFGPLKQSWYKVMRAHAREKPGVAIGKDTFSEKLKEAYLLFYKPLTVVNSFKSSGIYPVDSTKVRDSDLKPGFTYTHTDDEVEESGKAQQTKSSQEELDAQGALRAFEKALTTPIRKKYKTRMEEGYNVVGESPCFEVYKKLKFASEGRTSETSTEKEPVGNTTDAPLSGLEILANTALSHETATTSCDQSLEDPPSDTVVSPVLVESLVLPKSIKTTKMQPKKLLDKLPHHLTSDECLRTMALRDLSKLRAQAEKEKKAKLKYLAAAESSCSKRSKSKHSNIKSKASKKADLSRAGTSKGIGKTEEENEDDVKCEGCGMTWKEDQELGLGKIWVNCDFCNKWLHTDCCLNEVNIESDDPFCCPECAK
ncbi:uncharacterized protein LOC132757544 isoform X2 [Ruditapes philippinarum]|uniref:uncharacterized protein LOC132757544 isoform X2 n=1 Tax=Ruditapes philippinarum TaxID=129788 RepID=UPI00295B3E05|nr:uncharacterized protein LOC132757544 isoform X2 [Ruditapes philippinarum]